MPNFDQLIQQATSIQKYHDVQAHLLSLKMDCESSMGEELHAADVSNLAFRLFHLGKLCAQVIEAEGVHLCKASSEYFGGGGQDEGVSPIRVVLSSSKESSFEADPVDVEALSLLWNETVLKVIAVIQGQIEAVHREENRFLPHLCQVLLYEEQNIEALNQVKQAWDAWRARNQFLRFPDHEGRESDAQSTFGSPSRSLVVPDLDSEHFQTQDILSLSSSSCSLASSASSDEGDSDFLPNITSDEDGLNDTDEINITHKIDELLKGLESLYAHNQQQFKEKQLEIVRAITELDIYFVALKSVTESGSRNHQELVRRLSVVESYQKMISGALYNTVGQYCRVILEGLLSDCERLVNSISPFLKELQKKKQRPVLEPALFSNFSNMAIDFESKKELNRLLANEFDDDAYRCAFVFIDPRTKQIFIFSKALCVLDRIAQYCAESDLFSRGANSSQYFILSFSEEVLINVMKKWRADIEQKQSGLKLQS